MKIKKITAIKKYKSFIDYRWEQLCKNDSGQICYFSPFTIIFGENGSGKTAACEILKDLIGSQKFEEYTPERAEIELEVLEITSNKTPNGKVHTRRKRSKKIYKFENNLWNDPAPRQNEIIFFDVDFINKNIHSHGTISKLQGEHAQNAGKLIIDLDAEANSLKAKLMEQKKQLNNFETYNKDTLNMNFSDEDKKFYGQVHKKPTREKNKLLQEATLEAEERKKSEEQLIKLINKTTKIGALQGISLIPSLPQPSDEAIYKEIFQRDIKKSSEVKTDTAIKNHYLKHKSFLEKNENYKKITETPEKACPLCMQSLSGARKVISFYRKIFDKAYEKAREKYLINVKNLISELTNLQDILRKLPDSTSTVLNELEKISQDFKIDDLYIINDRQKYHKSFEKYNKSLKEYSELIRALEKLKTLEKDEIITDDLFGKVLTHVTDARKLITEFNKYIKGKNKIIADFKQKYSSKKKINTELVQVRDKMAKLEKIIVFFREDKISKIRKHIEMSSQEEKLTRKVKTAEEFLKKHLAEKIPQSVISEMTETLNCFNLNFSLQHIKPSSKTKDYSFSFKVIDKNKEEREFKKGLSEGERQVISLSLFFALNRNLSNKADKVLILDDPITSLDAPNLKILSDVIHKRTSEFGQIIVLTHHPLFFKYLKKCENPNPSEFGVAKNREEFGGSFIFSSSKFDLILELKNCYKEINNQAKKGTLKLEAVALKYGQLLRLAVEKFIKNDLLMWNMEKNFTELTDNLIRGKSRIRKLTDSDLDRVKSIYKYCSYSNLLHMDKEIPSAISELDNHIAEFIKISEKVN